MIDEIKIRYYIMIGWIVAFCILWFIFSIILPKEELFYELQFIESSIYEEDWHTAESHMKELNEIIKDKKIIINSNNSTEAHSEFEILIGQLEVAIELRQLHALEYIRGLRSIMDDLTKAFAGP